MAAQLSAVDVPRDFLIGNAPPALLCGVGRMVRDAVVKNRYSVDERDVLISVNSEWLAFAQENGAPQLTENAVLGRALWDFVKGAATVRLYQAVLGRVRSSGQPVVLPFRCDSPALRRYMRLEMTAGPGGVVHFAGILERVEATRPLSVLDASAARSDDFLTLCSWCKRALIETAGWLEVEDAAARLRLFEKEQMPRLVHDVCPDCLARLRQRTSPDQESRTPGELPA